MIIDNADDENMFCHVPGGPLVSSIGSQLPQSLLSYIPRCVNGSILVTSRNRAAAVKIAGAASIIDVPSMNKTEALDLLSSTIPSSTNSEDLERLAVLLDHIPLALVQAAAYIEERCIQISTYIEEYESNEKDRRELMSSEFTDLQRDLEVPNAVISTWSITFRHIQERNPAASRILSLMSYLDRSDIPKKFVIEQNSPREFDKAVGLLRSFAMVTSREGNSKYDLHGLTQLAMRNWIGFHDSETRYIDNLSTMLRNYISDVSENEAAACLPHVLAVLKHSDETSESVDGIDSAYLRYASQKGLYWNGNSKLMQSMLSRALEVFRKSLGEDHRVTIQCAHALAEATVRLGDYRAGLDLHFKAWEAADRYLGKTDGVTLQARLDYADTLRVQGQLTESERILRQLNETLDGLAMCDTIDDKANPHLLSVKDEVPIKNALPEDRFAWLKLQIVDTLLMTLLNQGRFTEARDFCDSTSSIDSFSRLRAEDKLYLRMKVCVATHEYQELELVSRNLLEFRRARYPEYHREVQYVVGYLVWSLRKQSKIAEALEIQEQGLQVQEDKYGPDSPGALSALRNYAVCLATHRQHDKAEKYMQRALRITSQDFEDSHPKTLLFLGELGNLYNKQQRFPEAEAVFTKWLIKERARDEPNTLDILSTLSGLARAIGKQGRHHEAAELLLQCAKGREGLWGKNHPKTLRAWFSHAVHLSKQGKHAEALDVHQQVLYSRKVVLGDDHIDTANSYEDVAIEIWNLKRYQEAVEFLHKAYDKSLAKLGPEHEICKRYKRRLDICLTQWDNEGHKLSQQGKHAKALAVHQQVLYSSKEVFGDDYVDIAQSYHDIATAMWDLVRIQEALESEGKAYAIALKKFGPDDAATKLYMANILLISERITQLEKATGVWMGNGGQLGRYKTLWLKQSRGCSGWER